MLSSEQVDWVTKDLRHLTVGWRAVLVPSRPPVQLLRVPGWAQQTREEQVEQVTWREVVEGLVQVAVQAVVLLVVFEVGVAGGHQMSRPRCRDGRKLGCGGRRASGLKELANSYRSRSRVRRAQRFAVAFSLDQLVALRRWCPRRSPALRGQRFRRHELGRELFVDLAMSVCPTSPSFRESAQRNSCSEGYSEFGRECEVGWWTGKGMNWIGRKVVRFR